MQITGHKTRSIFSRYDITSHDDLRAAGEQVNAFVTGTANMRGRESARVKQFKRTAMGQK
jgi:hypothetical protein